MPNFTKVATAAKSFACELYRLQPNALIPTPMSDVLRHVWDGFCGDELPPGGALPPPPTKPFNGGQCVCANYRFTYNAFGGGLGPSSTDRFVDVHGPITGSTLESVAGGTEVRLFIFCRGVIGGGCSLTEIKVGSIQWGATGSTPPNYRVVSVDPIGGAANNCGDPPPSFPPAPLAPPNGYTSPPTPIVFNDNTSNNYIFNFKPPLPPVAPASFFPPVVVNYLNTSIAPKFNIPIAFNFNGAVNFGGGGASFSQDDRDNINNIKNTTNNTSNTSNSTNNSVNNFYTDYKKDRARRINKEPLPTDFEPPKPPEAPGKKLVERLAYVNVDLSVIPSNAKSQSGKGAPNVVYAGWFEFLRKDKSFPRDYIHFANNCFIAPVGADGYAFTLYNGYQGTAVAVVFKE